MEPVSYISASAADYLLLKLVNCGTVGVIDSCGLVLLSCFEVILSCAET